MWRMRVIEQVMDGVWLIEPTVFGDHRGFFYESYSKKQYSGLGVDVEFVQDNHALSVKAGTLRGMHYQLSPEAQCKLVRVISGAIYDVVVDLRKDSATYSKWRGFELSADNQRQLLVPHGFAHGYCTLSDHTEVLYKVDAYYSPAHERGIRWNDPVLQIQWPTTDPLLSDKDKTLPAWEEMT